MPKLGLILCAGDCIVVETLPVAESKQTSLFVNAV
jgi:hypothetical protein